MEELLNKLIEKGRIPFGFEGVKKVKYAEQYYRNYNWVFWGGGWQQWRSIRQIVSKESGLWQFVCQNRMIRITETNSLCNWLFGEEIYYDETQTEKLYKNDNYEYWLIESALKDESELEQFLIDNIKI